MLIAAGFCDVGIHPEGLYFSVLADLVCAWLARLRPTLVRWTLALFAVPLFNWLVHREARAVPSAFVASHVSGYFITANRPA